jgi:hypothetical protein
VVERLPRKYEVLNSIPITATQTKKKKEGKEEGGRLELDIGTNR